MDSCIFHAAGHSPALSHAVFLLRQAGVTFTESLCPSVTHLLLPCPSFNSDGTLRGTAISLPEVDPSVCIIGGNLPFREERPFFDLLQDPVYVAQNAYITAHCALRLLMQHLPCVLRECRILVIGWGRIGKCLASLLKSLEAEVVVAARKESDRALLQALGYDCIDTAGLSGEGYEAIINTVPLMILPECSCKCQIDLASAPGLGSESVICARGLPGKDAPLSSGQLIAQRVLYYLNKEGCL